MRKPWSARLRIALIPLVGIMGAAAYSADAAGAERSNDALVLLLEQNRNLQAEVQALRSLVEEQGYEIRKLQRESLDRYTDSDARLSALEHSSSGQSTQAVNAPVANTAGIQAIPGVLTPTDASRIESAQDASSAAARPSSTPLARPTLEPVALSEQQLYQMAYESAVDSKFERAIAEFDQYLAIYPEGRFTTNVYYWRGQSFLYLSRYQEAIQAYETILQKYPSAPKVPDAMYGLGVAYEGMGNIQRARQLMQEIRNKYPNTGVANLADTRLRSLQ